MLLNALHGMAINPSAAPFSRVAIIDADETFLIPGDNSGEIRIKAWGAGGGGAHTYGYNGAGCGGGFVQCDVAATPGESLIVKVGAGGSGGALGGLGGGLTGVFRTSVTQGNALAVAGSGGGGFVSYVTGRFGDDDVGPGKEVVNQQFVGGHEVIGVD